MNKGRKIICHWGLSYGSLGARVSLRSVEPPDRIGRNWSHGREAAIAGNIPEVEKE